jgi:hypothetical protein
MSDLYDLLRRHGAPSPNAMAMPGETRSDDGLFFEVVTHPSPAPGTAPVTTIAEWSCVLTWKEIEDLQTFLNTNWATTGKKPEALFNDAMQFLGVGSYLGTFLTKHFGGSEIRMLLSYTPGKTIEQIYQAWGDFLQKPPAGWQDAVDAITKLRQYWLQGHERSQSGLMLLAGVDLKGRLADSTKFPFASIDRA